MTRPNRFSFCHVDGRLEEFGSPQGLGQIYADYQYITSIVVAADHAAPASGIHFVLTWAGNVIPKLKPEECVLVVVGDERGQVPNGVGLARWVFRTGSPKSPWPVMQFRQRPWSLLLLSSVRELRNLGLRVKRWSIRSAPLWTPRHVESIPIGFVGSTPLEPVAMKERKWDVSFAGSMGSFRVLGGRRLPGCPKSAARLAMLQATRDLLSTSPDLRMRIICPDLEPQTGLSKTDYYFLLQQTKISLCPRGNFVETFRLFESARFGCVILVDPLPDCWYYENHPFIEVRDWRKIKSAIEALRKDSQALEQLGERSRKWWDEVASPAAVGRKIARAVRPGS